MGNFIADNRDELSKRHYIRKAGSEDYWFDFYFNKLENYKSRFGSNFCLVIYGSKTEDDAYIMPYSQVASLFTEDLLDGRQPWMGIIKNNIIQLPFGKSMPISANYNDFELLETSETSDPQGVAESQAIYQTGDRIDKTALRAKIEEFNRKYKNTIPYKRQSISNSVARPGPITDYLKELRNYTCQICNEQGFLQANGTRYVEAHHIIELHKLIPGSYCSDNIIVVCPTCHKKLHYAKVSYSVVDSGNIEVSINNTVYAFSRVLLTEDTP